MYTLWVAKAVGIWQSGDMGKCKVAIGLMACFAAVCFGVLVVYAIILEVERRLTKKEKGTGKITRKHLTFPETEGRAIEDTDEVRRLGPLFTITLQFENMEPVEQVVKEELYDQLKIGGELPIVYQRKRLPKGIRILLAPRSSEDLARWGESWPRV